jgi:predicted membrane channel-forming protein YqfA (hemolysin III family)
VVWVMSLNWIHPRAALEATSSAIAAMNESVDLETWEKTWSSMPYAGTIVKLMMMERVFHVVMKIIL